MRAKFDGICKDLLWELAVSIGFDPVAQFNIDPQKRIEQLLGYVGEKDRRKSSVDFVWKHKLSKHGTFLANKVFADVVVTWEVDNSANSYKSINSSIENLDKLNPRLGVELLLIGTNLREINSFDRKFKNAVDTARGKHSRIIIIHDVNFAILFNSVTGTHPESLYKVYIDACKRDRVLAKELGKKLENLLKTSKMDSLDFRKEFVFSNIMLDVQLVSSSLNFYDLAFFIPTFRNSYQALNISGDFSGNPVQRPRSE